MNNFYATPQTSNCNTPGKSFSLKFRTQWLTMTFAFFALLVLDTYSVHATCNNVTNAGCIADDEANCGSFNPAAINNQASASGGSGTLEYIWKQSTDGGNTWTTISGATSSTYDPSTISVTTKYKRGAKRQYCSTYLWTNIITKTVNPVPPATITYSGSLNLCTGGSIVLQANTGSGYDYKWYRNGTVISGATSSSYTVTQAGNYKVLVNITATGCCQYSSEVCVTINNCCDNVTNGGTIGSDETNCGPYDPANITNVTSPSGGSGALEYIWQSLVGQGPWVTISGATSATYDPSTITETTCYKRLARRAGCTDYVGVSNIVVKTVNPLPPADITYSGSLNLCTGGSIVLQAPSDPSYDYKWYRNGTLISGATASSYTATQAGNYKVLVNITATGCCRYSSEVTVTVNTCCDNVTDGGTIAADQSNCGAFDAALLTSVNAPSGGSGTLEIVWITRTWNGSSWGNWNMISGATGLTYDPGVISVNTQFRRCARRAGCTDYVGESNIITITINAGITVSCSPTNGTCTNGNLGSATVNPSGGSGYTYLWNTGATTQSISGLSAGTYSVGVTSANGCSASCSVTISTVACCNVNYAGEIGHNESYCGSYDPEEIVSLSAPSGGSGDLEIVWIYRTWNGTNWSNWNMISGATGLSYDPSTITLTTQYRRCARRSGCTDYVGETNIITKTVNSGIDLACNMTNVTSYGASNGVAAVTISGGTAPYTYLWNNEATTASLTNVPAGVYSVTVTDANGCSAFIECSITQPPLDCTGFRTQTQGGWGQCHQNGNNPGTYLFANFASAFPSGLTVGCTNQLKLTSAQAVCEFLPSGSTPSGLPSGTLTNPGGSYNNVLAGQVVALTLNVVFDQANPNFAPSTSLLKDLLINSGTFANWTVQQLLDEANRKLGGCSSSYSFSQLNEAVSRVNENFVDGNITGSYLACCGNMTASCTKTDADCYGTSTGSVSASATGATAPVSYLWSNGATTATVNNLAAGTYSVTVTDARNCTATCTVSVSQPQAELSVNCSSVNGTCTNNNQGSVTSSVSGGTAPYSYLWSNGATTSSITGISAGTYSLTVTDASGCISTCSKTVTITPCCNVTDGGEIGYDQENCGPLDVAELVTLSPPTGGLGNLEIVWITRSWTGSNWSNWEMIPGATGLSYDPGTVSVTTQYRRCARRSGCTDYIGESNIITITVNPQPTAQCSSVNGTCANNNLGSASVTVTSGTAPFSYVWNNGATTSSISGLGAGTYSVTVTDVEGCSAQCSATVTITPCCNVTDGGEIGYDQENCGPLDVAELVTLSPPTGGLGNLEIVWITRSWTGSNWSNWEMIPGATGLSYDPGTVSVTTQYRRCARRAGCTDYIGESNIITITVNPQPTAQCSSVNGTCANNNLGSASVTVTSGTAPFSYVWNNGATTASISNLSAGTYSVTVTDAEGCSAQCSATVTITPCCNVTDGGEIGYDQENCGPLDVAELVTLSPPTGGLGNLEIVWITRSWTGSNWSNWEMIPGATGLSYDPGMVSVTTQYRRCARRAGCSDYIGESNIITITINPQPTAQCSSVNGTCANNNLGSASVTVTSGTAPFSYVWNNGATTASISGLAAGTYSVTVTDAEGCSVQCSATVTVTPCCNVTDGGEIGYDQENCGPLDVAELVTLSPPTGGLGNLEIVWITRTWTGSNWSNWTMISGASGLTYDPSTVTVTTQYRRCARRAGCTDYIGESNIITISVNPQPTAQCSSENGTCANNNLGRASITVTTGTAPFSYVWSNGATTSSISGLGAGTYSVTVTDAEGCSAQCSATVIITPCCNVTNGGQIGSEQENCGPFDPAAITSIQDPTGGLGALEYVWLYNHNQVPFNNGQNGWVEIPNSNSASYDPGQITQTTCYIRCSRRSGCTDYVGESNVVCMIVNPVPTANCSSVNGTCTNNNLGSASVTVTSGTAPFSYVWSNGATTSSISGLGAGTYSVTVTDAEGCSAQCSATVTITPCCNVTNGGQIGSEQENCGPFDPAAITSIQDPTGGLGALEYVWLYNHNQVPFNNGQNGWVEIPNSNSASYDPGQITQTTCYIRCSRRSGCTDYVGESNVVCMIVNPVPTAQCSSVNGTCANNNLGSASVTVTSGTAPFSYVWNNGATTASISNLSAGTYSVTVTDAEGCSAQCSATVTITPCCNVTDGGEIGYDQENCGPFDPSELVNLSPPTGGLGDLEVLWIYRVWTGSDWENDWHFVPGSHDLLSYDPGMITVSTQFRRCARRSGCEDYIGETNIITITINPVPTAQCSKTDVLCHGEQTGSASVSASGGTAPYSYVWSNGGTDAAISGVGAGVYSVTVTDAEGCTATCSVEVSQPQSALLANCEAGYVACYGESTGSAVVLAQGGTAPYSYLWSNGATNATIDGLAAGSYSVIITDANGCTASCSIEVTQPEAPLAAQCSSTAASCYEAQDGTVSADVSGGTAPYSYSWSNGATTASVNDLSAGVYSVTVTDAEGCSTTCSVEVGQAAGLQITCSGTPAVCNGDASGSASVSASGGTAPYSYLWSNGATTASVNGLEAGVYTVVVTDAHGCSDECSYSVEEPSDLSAQCSASDVLCFGGNDGSVSVAAVGGVAPYSYQWSNGSTDATVNGLTAGAYSVTVTDANGCTEICTAVVSQPQNELLATCEAGPVSCYGAGDGEAVVLAQGGTAPYTYFWNNEMTEPFIGNLVPGTYTVIVTDANGCTATCSVEVTEPEPFNVSISADGPLTFCEGGSVTLTASAAASYVWLPGGETTQSIVVSTSGSYSVWALDETGCEATSDPVTVVVNPNPTPEVSAGGPLTFCEGECVTLTSTAAASFLWNNGATTQSITVCEAGEYSVSVVDENGCEGTSAPVSVVVNTVEPPVIDVDGDSTVCAGECVDLTVLYSGESPNFLWSNGETSQVISVCETGTFTVTYTSENGCSATSEPVTVTVNPNPTPEISADGPTTFCEGNCVTLTADAGYISYLWSTGETTQSINVCESGQYLVTVFDENGCRGVSGIGVVVNPNPTPEVSADGPTTFCEGGCVTLTSSAAASYLWSNGATTQSITVCEAGDYSVSIVDENGCEGTSAPVSVVVNSNPTPIVSASGPTEFCEGECVTLTSSQAANYLWSNGATTQSITVCEAGSFTVSVVDENGCEGTSAPVSVVVNPNPTPTISADGPTSFCAGNCVTLTATSSASYLWTNGATTQSITVCESGDYGVSVIDENGCQGGSVPVSVNVLEVEPPVINVDGSSTVCAGECVDLIALYSGESPNFVWSNGEVTQIITVCESGSYTVTLTAENGCTATSEPVTITVNPNPIPEISADGPTTFCEGECVTLTSSVAASYLWSNGATTQLITVCEAGSYSVTVTDENGCSGTSAPVSVTVNIGTTPTVTADGPTDICNGTCVTLTASAGVSYLWSNGETTQSISVCEEGSFTVTVTDENGCSGTSAPVIVTLTPGPTPEITVDGPTTFCEGGCVTLSASYSGEIGYFLWSNGETTQTITVCETGDYYVTVTDESGCYGTSADTVHIVVGQGVPPTVTADGSTEICEGDSVTLTANSPNAVSYQWYQNGIAIPGATDQSITVSDFADFYVVVTDQYGCTAQSNLVLVKVGEIPEVSLGEDVTICPGDEVTLTASGATYYVWSNGATTQSITVSPDEATDYVVTGTNPFCNLSDSDTVTVYISSLPVAAGEASDDPSLGNPVNFTDVSGDNSIVTWFWDFGDGNNAVTQNTHHTYDTEGTFTVILTVENQYGCTAYDTLEVDINQVILIPNIITPNNDGLNDGFGIKNNGVDQYGLTIFNRWGQIVFEREAREIQWNGTTNSGTDLEAGTYFYVLVVDNGSKGTFEKTGFITLVR